MTDNTEDREEEEKSGRFSGLVSRFRGSSDDEPDATEADEPEPEEATADAPEEGSSGLFGRLKGKLSRGQADDGDDADAEEPLDVEGTHEAPEPTAAEIPAADAGVEQDDDDPASDADEEGSKGLLGRLKAKVTRSDGTEASEDPEAEPLEAEEEVEEDAGGEAEDEGEIELTDEPLVAEATADPAEQEAEPDEAEEEDEPASVEAAADEGDDADVAAEVEEEDEEPTSGDPASEVVPELAPEIAPEAVAPKGLESPPPTAPVRADEATREIEATPQPPEPAEPEPVRPVPAEAGKPEAYDQVREKVEAALERRRGSPPRLLRSSSGDR